VLKNCEEGSDRMLIFLSCMLLLLSNIGVFKSRRMRWVEHVEHMGEENVSRVWWGNLKKRDHLVHLGVDGNIMLKWTPNILGVWI